VRTGGQSDENFDQKSTHHVVCTLAEGHYFNGVAALANSLVRAGFKGSIVVGYRGAPPNWLQAFNRVSQDNYYDICPSVRLHLLEIGGDWHLANCKPQLVERLLFEMFPEAELVYFFDTDMVVNYRWDAFAKWVDAGVVMVLDVADTYMHPRHVYRESWRALAAKQGLGCRDVTGYVNSGCVGVSRTNADFVRVWSRLMEELERAGANMRVMKTDTGDLAFSRMDQDVLNATVMATQTPVALLGPEAMGMFPWFGNVMPHAMWLRKPWVRNYIIDAIRGFPPGRVHLAYWDFVDGPIRPFSPLKLALKRAYLRIGHVIGLLHSRSVRDI
jgi:hypothetical protein